MSSAVFGHPVAVVRPAVFVACLQKLEHEAVRQIPAESILQLLPPSLLLPSVELGTAQMSFLFSWPLLPWPVSFVPPAAAWPALAELQLPWCRVYMCDLCPFRKLALIWET